MRAIPCCSLLLVAVGVLYAEGEPALPYYDWGACPFECCTYREWPTNAKVELRKDIGSKTVVARLAQGANVLGLTGVVITTKPGRIKILQPFTLDEQNPVDAIPGDILHTLHYVGEGYDRFWFKGGLHDEQLVAFEVEPRPTAAATWQVLAGEGPRQDRSGGVVQGDQET